MRLAGIEVSGCFVHGVSGLKMEGGLIPFFLWLINAYRTMEGNQFIP